MTMAASPQLGIIRRTEVAGKLVLRLLKLVIAGAVVSGISSVAQAQVRVIASNPQGSIFYAASVVIGKLLDEKLKI